MRYLSPLQMKQHKYSLQVGETSHRLWQPGTGSTHWPETLHYFQPWYRVTLKTLKTTSMQDRSLPKGTDPTCDPNHPFCPEFIGDLSVGTSLSSEEDSWATQPPKRKTLGKQTPSTTCVNLSLTWSVTRGNQATAVSFNIREKPYRQKTSVASFLGRISHVAIILLLIFGARILNYLVFFVSKSSDKWCSRWIQTVRTWWQSNISTGAREKFCSSL